jgi:hypothetical protein
VTAASVSAIIAVAAVRRQCSGRADARYQQRDIDNIGAQHARLRCANNTMRKYSVQHRNGRDDRDARAVRSTSRTPVCHAARAATAAMAPTAGTIPPSRYSSANEIAMSRGVEPSTGSREVD